MRQRQTPSQRASTRPPWFFATCALLTSLCTATVAPADDPPLPDPDRPVDYNAWVNQEFGGRVKENAAEKHRTAFKAFVAPTRTLNEQIAKISRSLYNVGKDGPDTIPAWLAANERSLALFAEAARMPDCYFPRSSESGLLMDALLPHTSYFRNGCIALEVRLHERSTTGDVQGALEDFDTMLRASRQERQQPSLVEWLGGAIHASRAYAALRRWLAQAEQPLAYREMLKRVCTADADPATPCDLLQVEKATFWETFQQEGPEGETLSRNRDDLRAAIQGN